MLPERTPPPELSEAWIRECLNAGAGHATLTVSGTCMAPSLPEGSRVTLRSPSGSVRVGDVVLLRTPAGLRLHRVLLRFRHTIRTKGDHGIYLDSAGSLAAVIAVCDTGESRGGRLLKAGRSLASLLIRRLSLRREGREGDVAHTGLLP